MEAPGPWPNNPYNHCLNEASKALHEGPHTSFKMMETILEVMELEPRDILRDPSRLLNFRGDLVRDRQLFSTYHDTWRSRTGRCTSIALRVVHGLSHLYQNDGFEFFDLGKHRVGRCRRYGFVIDSETNQEIQVLPAVSGASTLPHRSSGNWMRTNNDDRGRWMYYNNQLVFEPKPDTGATPTSRRLPAISNTEALANCLQDVARQAVLVCAFRSSRLDMQNQTMSVVYYGLIRWRLAKRRIELTPDLNDKDQYATITFGDGTRDSHETCTYNFTVFLRACGLEYQWKADGIDRFHRELWKAAVIEWGNPVWRAVAHPDD